MEAYREVVRISDPTSQEAYIENVVGKLIPTGFKKLVGIKEELVDFLKKGDFGRVDNNFELGNAPVGTYVFSVHDLLTPILDNKVLSRYVLRELFDLYFIRNKLKTGGYYKVDRLMEQLLGSQLTKLEQDGRFDRNRFGYKDIYRIIAGFVIPSNNLSPSHFKLTQNVALTMIVESIGMTLHKKLTEL